MNKQNKIAIAALLGIMCCFLTAGILIQVRTVKYSSTTVGKTLAENELRDSVLRWKEKYENAYEKLNRKEAELEKLRSNVSNSSVSSSGLSQKLDNYNLLLGYNEVVGKGVIVTLSDGDSSLIKGSPMEYIVHDQDIYEVVNALKNSGAEAISVNGQRITSRTGITCVGTVITINGEKVGAPFVIKAIGSPYNLYSSVTIAGGYVQYIKSLGVQVDVKQVEKDTIVIPKYEGVYTFKHASNIE